ncbi:MAG: type II secretion system F family protein [Candidatus Omnitrophica bacterium]|nr:type II secretion system F family protein [Candidatus Omnitrophota bacterium]
MHFTYKAKHGPDKIIEGTLEADSIEKAVSKIMRLGYNPLDVKQASRKDFVKHRVGKSAGRRVSFADLALFTRQLSDLLDAGVPMLRTLGILKDQIKNADFKAVLNDIYEHVRDGGTLSSSLALFPGIFPPLYVNMVKAGEVGGNLVGVLQRLADFVEKEQEWRSQIITSLIYPALILVVGVGTIFVLLTWVIPRISDIFTDFSETLPWPTFILMALSSFFSKFWWLIILLAIGGFFYTKKLLQIPQGKLWLDGKKLRLPLFGPFIRDAEISRFARTLATLLANGVVIVPALEAVCAVIENEIIRRQVREITRQVTGGVSLAQAVRGCDLFEETVVNMISVGEESGNLHKGLHKLGEYYERQTQRFIKRVTSLIEPLLILGVGLIVGFMVIAMLLPILQMNLMIQ